MSSPFRGFVQLKKLIYKIFTKTSVLKMKLIQFSIAQACLRRIFQCGLIYLHFAYNDTFATISKKWCFEKYCSCDKACQFSAL